MSDRWRRVRNIFLAGAVFGGGAAVGILAVGGAQRVDPAGLSGVLATRAEASPPPTLSVSGSPIADVVQRVSPGIVTVGAVKRGWVAEPQDDFYSPFFYRRRAVQMRTPYVGSGFLIDQEGHVLTNFHVIEDSAEVFVTFSDGREVAAKVLDADRFVDMALLKVDLPDKELPDPIELADSDVLRIGETAMAFGYPFGTLLQDPMPTVTAGVISASHRFFQPDQRAMRVYQDMIQTDAAINPGNSGGPLIDIHGRAIGINTFIFTRSGDSSGIGFAIPINRAKAFIEEIKKYGRIRPLLKDFEVMTVTRQDLQGVVVSYVAEGGPASEVGLEIGDVIVGVDGRSVRSREDFILMLASKQVGDELKLDVLEGKGTRTVGYKVSEAPEKAAPRLR